MIPTSPWQVLGETDNDGRTPLGLAVLVRGGINVMRGGSVVKDQVMLPNEGGYGLLPWRVVCRGDALNVSEYFFLPYSLWTLHSGTFDEQHPI